MRPLPKLLSKTKIMRGYRCRKSIYLTIHQPELEPPVTPQQQAIFDQGNRVGEVARTYFPGGELVDNKPWDFVGSLRRTRDLLKSGVEFIYEAAFEYKGCYARADILRFSPTTKRWTLIEVKSSTKVKDEHIEDVGLQAWIVANSGLPLERISILHLNPECRHPDLSNLFIEVDVTDRLREAYREIAPRLDAIFKTIRHPEVPDVDIGPHCARNRDCEFKAHCFGARQIPDVSVFNIPKIGAAAWEHYKNGRLNLDQIDTLELSTAQARMVRVHLENRAFVDHEGLAQALSTWKYPLVYLDFETINPPIPEHPGCAPYTQVPFQFSAHVQSAPAAPLTHHEFLFDQAGDPRAALIPPLLAACGTKGSIVSYFASFEKSRIEELAEYSPEHRDALLALLDRFVDPLILIREHVYDPGFAGSFSLKAVAPALLGDELSYEGMAVGDGSAAQRAYAEMVADGTPPDRKAALRAALLEYCEQDTLAMVRVTEWLKQAPKTPR